MANKRSRELSKAIKKLRPAQRQQIAERPDFRGVLSTLTPTEYAELFPKQYLRGLPDISGFREVISRDTAKKQAAEQEAYRKGVAEQMGRQGESIQSIQRYGAGAAAGDPGWDKKAPGVMQRLMKDLNLTKEQAAGIVGSLKPESGLTAIQERDPIGGGRGGFGWAQWTGDRRVAFERFAASRGMNVTDDEANYQFLLHELKTTQAGELERLRSASSAEEAAHIFTGSTREKVGFLRPGAEHYSQSEKAAARALSLYSQSGEGGATPASQTPTAVTPSSAAPGVPMPIQSSVGYANHNGYIAPQDQSQYDPRNVEQCATLTKGFVDVGRSNGWKVRHVDPSQIQKGQAVATEQYNNAGGDKTHSGYHTGIVVQPPGPDGKMLILNQWAGSGGAKLSWVNYNAYSTGKEGGTTRYGLIESGGKLHTEVSQAAIDHANKLGADKMIAEGGSTPAMPVGSGPAPGEPTTTGSVDVAGQPTTPTVDATTPLGQTASLLQPLQMIAGMLPGPIGGVIGSVMPLMQTAMPIIGNLVGMMQQGEGIGDSEEPTITSSGLTNKSKLIEHKSTHAAPSIGASQEHYNAFRESIAKIESSGGNYNLRGGSSNRFAGAYQMGADEIKEVAKTLGETAPVSRMKGSRKLAANDTFLNDPKMQERYFDAFVKQHHDYLMKKNKQYATMNPEERLKVLGYAHNQGAEGANKWLNTGIVKSDQFKTEATKYSNLIGKNLDNLRMAQRTTTAPQVATASVPSGTPTETPAATSGLKEMAQSFFSGQKAQAAPKITTPGSMNISAQPAPPTGPTVSPETSSALGIPQTKVNPTQLGPGPNQFELLRNQMLNQGVAPPPQQKQKRTEVMPENVDTNHQNMIAGLPALGSRNRSPSLDRSIGKTFFNESATRGFDNDLSWSNKIG